MHGFVKDVGNRERALPRRTVLLGLVSMLAPVALTGCVRRETRDMTREVTGMATPAVTDVRFVPETVPRTWLDLYNTRTIYTSLDAETLAIIPDNQLTWAVGDSLYKQLKDQDDLDRAIRDLRPGFAAFYHVNGLQGQVNNGGIHQFFFNSTGRYAYETFDACRRVGSVEITEIVAEAIELEKRIGTPGSQFPDAGVGTSVEFPDSAYAGYADLDDRFYSSKENLEALCNQYIRFHPDEFIGSIFPQAQ